MVFLDNKAVLFPWLMSLVPLEEPQIINLFTRSIIMRTQEAPFKEAIHNEYNTDNMTY